MFEKFIGHGWGSIDLDFENVGFALGETIDGHLTIKAKRQMGPCRLRTAIVCQEKAARVVPTRVSRRGARVQRQSTSQELWRAEYLVDADFDLTAGEVARYPIRVRLPPALNEGKSEDLPDWAKGAIALLNTVTFTSASISWEVRAKLDHPGGFALRHRVPVSVLM